jgi:hypothetical protein
LTDELSGTSWYAVADNLGVLHSFNVFYYTDGLVSLFRCITNHERSNLQWIYTPVALTGFQGAWAIRKQRSHFVTVLSQLSSWLQLAVSQYWCLTAKLIVSMALGFFILRCWFFSSRS